MLPLLRIVQKGVVVLVGYIRYQYVPIRELLAVFVFLNIVVQIHRH